MKAAQIGRESAGIFDGHPAAVADQASARHTVLKSKYESETEDSETDTSSSGINMKNTIL